MITIRWENAESRSDSCKMPPKELWKGPCSSGCVRGHLWAFMFLGTVLSLWTACNSWWSHFQMGGTEIIIGPLQFSTLITYYSWEVFWKLPKWNQLLFYLSVLSVTWLEQLASGYLHAYVTNKFKWLLALALARNHIVLWRLLQNRPTKRRVSIDWKYNRL